MATTPAVLTANTGEGHHGGPIWWICTRDRDIYVEELGLSPSIVGIRACGLDGTPLGDQHLGSRDNLRQALRFDMVRPAEFMNMMTEVRREQEQLGAAGTFTI